MNDLSRLIARAEALLERVESLLPPAAAAPDWKASTAFRWRKRAGGRGHLEPVAKPHRIRLKDLRNVDEQKQRIECGEADEARDDDAASLVVEAEGGGQRHVMHGEADGQGGERHEGERQLGEAARLAAKLGEAWRTVGHGDALTLRYRAPA